MGEDPLASICERSKRNSEEQRKIHVGGAVEEGKDFRGIRNDLKRGFK